MRQLIVDTETTGLYPEKGHRIIEFAALEMVNRKLTGNYLHLYINPEREIDIEATKIHGITNEHVVDKPTFAELVDDIVKYINGAELIIHNAKFDIGFLDYQFKMHNLNATNEYVLSVIDTLIMARQKFPGGKNSLDALCDRFSIDRGHRDYHGALIDCRLLADVYLALTREQISLLGDNQTVGGKIPKFEFARLSTPELALKVVSPLPEEIAAHEAYLQALDKASSGSCLWYNQIKSEH